ncbi:MAG: hypothetical protein ACFB0B_20430 [Thermonemataceae bacterium]
MTTKKAKQIGSQQGLLLAGIGVFLAYLLVMLLLYPSESLLKTLFWILEADYQVNLITGVVFFLFCGYLFGQLAGWLILIKQWNATFTGALLGLAILFTATFLTSWVGFFQEGIHDLGTPANSFYDYIFKPVFWVTMAGVFPASIAGAWFGWRIKRKGKGYLQAGEG